ncbi:unnamed protein product [Caenorhabditis auriculariae]|uniref:Uncharacterized protein n=1 Tax=Caenorhabditis auriculariae TaxID=2777116 RepID=A0A8S1GRX1_9PELO|nr:unnamed protein product [Caenorhabditis auriculariae]
MSINRPAGENLCW